MNPNDVIELIHAGFTKQDILTLFNNVQPVQPETTQVVPETTQVIPETTQVVPETTQVIPETTQVVPETTQVVQETTQVVPETNQPDYATRINSLEQSIKDLTSVIQASNIKTNMVDTIKGQTAEDVLAEIIRPTRSKKE